MPKKAPKIVEATLNGEFTMKLLDFRAERPEWYTSKGWEKKRLKSMHKHINEGDVVYYIGAEEGEMPALCQIWGAQVCLFEPNHAAWPIIKATWDANELDKPLGIYPCFVSSRENFEPKNPDKELYDGKGWELITDNDQPDYDWPYYVRGEIRKDHGFSNLSEEREGLPEVTLDAVAEVQFGPDAIIMDVEGAEWEVLQGAKTVLELYKPKIWLSLHPEFLIQQYGVYSRTVRDFLIDQGYKETLLEYEHEVHLFYKHKDDKR